MVLGSDLDIAALGELERAVVAALKGAGARVVHVPDGQAVVNLFGYTAVTWLDTDDGRLVDVVAFQTGRGTDATGIGIEHRQHKVAVTQATPAPVDVEQVTVGIAVAHKRVSAARAGTAVVNHGTALGQLVVNQVFPVTLLIVAAVNQLGVIVEVIVQGCGNVGVAGARCVQAILHVGSTAGIEHEPCYSIPLGLSLGTGIVVAHVVPVKHDGMERVGIECTVLFLPIEGDNIGRNRLAAIERVLVIVHDLGHRRGYTARVGQFTNGVAVLGNIHELGAVLPIGCALVPVAGDQRRDTVACGLHGKAGLIGLGHAQCVEGRNLLAVVLQPGLHVRGHMVGVERALVDIAQDGDSAVVTRNDDITLVALGIEDVITWRLLAVASHLGSAGRGGLYCYTRTVLTQKMAC